MGWVRVLGAVAQGPRRNQAEARSAGLEVGVLSRWQAVLAEQAVLALVLCCQARSACRGSEPSRLAQVQGDRQSTREGRCLAHLVLQVLLHTEPGKVHAYAEVAYRVPRRIMHSFDVLHCAEEGGSGGRVTAYVGQLLAQARQLLVLAPYCLYSAVHEARSGHRGGLVRF